MPAPYRNKLFYKDRMKACMLIKEDTSVEFCFFFKLVSLSLVVLSSGRYKSLRDKMKFIRPSIEFTKEEKKTKQAIRREELLANLYQASVSTVSSIRSWCHETMTLIQTMLCLETTKENLVYSYGNQS